MNGWLKLGAVITVLAVIGVNEAAAQPAGPLVPAITPEQINHATAAQYSFCNQAGVPPGIERRPPPSLRQVTAKADVVKALDDSVAYCDNVLKAASEAWLMEIAPRLGGATSGLIDGIRAHAFMYNNVHDAEDYGTLTIYLRLQGLVPPSSALHPAAPPK